MKYSYLAVILTLLMLLSACSNEHFTPLPKDVSILSTVNIKDMTVSFYDMENERKLDDWEVSRPYVGGVIFPDKDTLLLYGKTVGTVDLYSLSEGRKIKSWKTGEGIVNGMLVNNGKEIALADQNRNSIRFFSLIGEETAETKIGEKPLTLLDGGNNRLYVMSYNHEHLGLIDLTDKKRLAGFNIHPAAAGAILNEKKSELWIGGHGAGTVAEEKIHVYDLESGKLKREIPAPVMPVNFESDGTNIFVLSHGSSTLYKMGVDGEKKASIKVGANPFELQMFKEKLIVAGYDSNEIYIIDPDRMEVEEKVKVGKGPFQIVTCER